VSLPVAILAGGLATRLRPASEVVPKVLFDVGGEPFVMRQLRHLRGQGIRRAVLCVGHLGGQVEAVIGDGSRLGIEVEYSWDGPELLGTGGAIRRALTLLGPEFFVLYGDAYLPVNFRAVEFAFRQAGQPALMTVYRNAGRWDTSNVEYVGGRILEYDKRTPRSGMEHIDYGLSVLTADGLESSGMGSRFDLADLFHQFAKAGRLAGHAVHRRFYEIGSQSGLRETTEYFERMSVSYSRQHLDEASQIIAQIDIEAVEAMAELLASLKAEGGRLFFLGVGGSAANCSHAVNDFRKIGGIECYAPTDNVSELTARTNDEGWETTFVEWLRTSRLSADDAIFVFSVGGGDVERNVSPNLVRALQHARDVGAKILGIVGRDGGFTARVADACVIIPTVNPGTVTPHAEAFQAVIWHLLISHPGLKANQTKWEAVAP
jgi:D-sedoheptulose 7-phosphate isomerase